MPDGVGDSVSCVPWPLLLVHAGIEEFRYFKLCVIDSFMLYLDTDGVGIRSYMAYSPNHSATREANKYLYG